MGLTDYHLRSKRLSGAGRQYLSALQGQSGNLRGAADDLYDAALSSPAEVAFRFTGEAAAPKPQKEAANVMDELPDTLFDFQSATVLIWSGLAEEGPDKEKAAAHLEQVLDSIDQSAGLSFAFAPHSVVRSEDLVSAKKTFEEDCQFALDTVVRETDSFLWSIFSEIKKRVDPGALLDAIGNLGGPFQTVADTGKTLREGLKKLRDTIEKILHWFGDGAAPAIKEKAKEIWDKLTGGTYSKDILGFIVGASLVEEKVTAVLHSPHAALDRLDVASNRLRPMAEGYASGMKVLHGIMSAVGLLAGGLGAATLYFHVALPWLPAITAIAYGALLGSAVIMGMEYAGRPIFHSVTGVRQIVTETL